MFKAFKNVFGSLRLIGDHPGQFAQKTISAITGELHHFIVCFQKGGLGNVSMNEAREKMDIFLLHLQGTYIL